MGPGPLGTNLEPLSPLLTGAEAPSAPCFMRKVRRVRRDAAQFSGSPVSPGKSGEVWGRFFCLTFIASGCRIRMLRSKGNAVIELFVRGVRSRQALIRNDCRSDARDGVAVGGVLL